MCSVIYTQSDKYINSENQIIYIGQNVLQTLIKLYIIPTLFINYPRVIKIYEICGPRMSHICYGFRRHWCFICEELHFKIWLT